MLSEYAINYQHQMTHLRSFPEGTRNCYKINVENGTKYLIKASFLYGNYDFRSKTPVFDLHHGVNFWDTASLKSVSTGLVGTEIIHTPRRDYIYICLINTGTGTPFIQAIELRTEWWANKQDFEYGFLVLVFIIETCYFFT